MCQGLSERVIVPPKDTLDLTSFANSSLFSSVADLEKSRSQGKVSHLQCQDESLCFLMATGKENKKEKGSSHDCINMYWLVFKET